MSNMFHEAKMLSQAQQEERQKHFHHAPAGDFFKHINEDLARQRANKEKARNMTRQQQFDNGFITCEDLDDEELRLGRCRDAHGKIPPVSRTMESVPRDLYDEMVAEHQKRTQEKYRQMMDDALNTVLEIMIDPTVEPKDRLQAAIHVKEQVIGKTPDRVHVVQTKAPWEELMGDVARLTRAQHNALKEGTIDAEVVEGPIDTGVAQDVWASTFVPGDGEARIEQSVGGVHDAGPEDVGSAGNRSDVQSIGSGVRRVVDTGEVARADTTSGKQERFDYEPLIAPTTFEPATPAPSFDNQASSNPLSQQIREAQMAGAQLATARKAKREMIRSAKAKRIAQRTLGVDEIKRKLKGVSLAPVQDRLMAAMEDDQNPTYNTSSGDEREPGDTG